MMKDSEITTFYVYECECIVINTVDDIRISFNAEWKNNYDIWFCYLVWLLLELLKRLIPNLHSSCNAYIPLKWGRSAYHIINSGGNKRPWANPSPWKQTAGLAGFTGETKHFPCTHGLNIYVFLIYSLVASCCFKTDSLVKPHQGKQLQVAYFCPLFFLFVVMLSQTEKFSFFPYAVKLLHCNKDSICLCILCNAHLLCYNAFILRFYVFYLLCALMSLSFPFWSGLWEIMISKHFTVNLYCHDMHDGDISMLNNVEGYFLLSSLSLAPATLFYSFPLMSSRGTIGEIKGQNNKIYNWMVAFLLPIYLCLLASFLSFCHSHHLWPCFTPIPYHHLLSSSVLHLSRLLYTTFQYSPSSSLYLSSVISSSPPFSLSPSLYWKVPLA